MSSSGRYDMTKLFTITDILLNHKPIPASYMDHPLKGEWVGHKGLHIQGDWVLIYQINEEALILKECRTGTHSELFKESKNIKRSKIMTIREAKRIVERCGLKPIKEKVTDLGFRGFGLGVGNYETWPVDIYEKGIVPLAVEFYKMDKDTYSAPPGSTIKAKKLYKKLKSVLDKVSYDDIQEHSKYNGTETEADFENQKREMLDMAKVYIKSIEKKETGHGADGMTSYSSF
ncbi:hypothetical protein AGMMS49944_03600 [Spirochaetia bacterium]|nr:hypothetical protein AGMMS49944_03600 [Spirochaetia bacterium]